MASFADPGLDSDTLVALATVLRAVPSSRIDFREDGPELGTVEQLYDHYGVVAPAAGSFQVWELGPCESKHVKDHRSTLAILLIVFGSFGGMLLVFGLKALLCDKTCPGQPNYSGGCCWCPEPGSAWAPATEAAPPEAERPDAEVAKEPAGVPRYSGQPP